MHRVGRTFGIALLVLAACGCARTLRIQQNGLTCNEAYRVAIAAVRRMSYTINAVNKPTPGSPGLITASRSAGTEIQGLVVQIFCTTMGAEVEATTDTGGVAQLSFPDEFRRSFAAAAAAPPPRAAAESGLDVLLTPERGAIEGVNLAANILAVTVRISNHTPRAYRFTAAEVVLQTSSGDRIKPLPVAQLTEHLDASGADALRRKAVADRDLAPNDTLTGLLFFPFQSYTRARVVLTDLASDEPEGFSIEF